MSLVFVDGELERTLHDADKPIQMCTSQGKVLGFFTPAKSVPLDVDPGISGDEVRRRMADRTGRPLADILRDLEKRA